jgi:hypothetical protein
LGSSSSSRSRFPGHYSAKISREPWGSEHGGTVTHHGSAGNHTYCIFIWYYLGVS